MKKILSEMKNLLMRLTTNKPHCRRKKNSELEGIAIQNISKTKHRRKKKKRLPKKKKNEQNLHDFWNNSNQSSSCEMEVPGEQENRRIGEGIIQ